MGSASRILDAVRFLTIMPTPPSEALPADWLPRALPYFPLVGAFIGGVSAGVLLLAGHFWSGVVPALLAVTVSIVLTGGLHEDGLADTADSLGGRNTEQRLAIMKDSRIGSYGAMALGLGIALRVATLAMLPMWTAAAALIAVHAAARMTPGIVMHWLPYAGDTASQKVAYAGTSMQSSEFIVALLITLLALAPVIFISASATLVGVVTGSVLASGIGIWARKCLGGHTGDVLGAVEQVFEIGFLLGVAAVIG